LQLYSDIKFKSPSAYRTNFLNSDFINRLLKTLQRML